MDKTILIVANNALSQNNNNGKTLLSLFSHLQNFQLFELFFSSETPSININGYFRISDVDAIRYKICKKNESFGPILRSASTERQEPRRPRRHSQVSRAFRELFWNGIWNNRAFNEWILKINPAYVFFLAGDSLFAYKFVEKIKKDLCKSCKLSMFITDDYVDRSGFHTLTDLFRRKQIEDEIRNVLGLSEKFYTISEKMREFYLKKFNRDSAVLFNVEDMSLATSRISAVPQSLEKGEADSVRFIYAGSLYYGRDLAIADFAEEISKINFGKRLTVVVCSNQLPRCRKFLMLCKKGTIVFLGQLDQEALKELYQKADFLLYAESFKKRFVQKIRYSFSTKICDYLSSNKPIICFGPLDVGSIEVLFPYSAVIQDVKDVQKTILKYLYSDEAKNDLTQASIAGYQKLITKNKIISSFLEAFQDEDSPI